MNRLQIIGAIKYPAFLLIWSAGLVLFMGQLYPADAALIRHAERALLVSGMDPLPPVPSMKDLRALGSSLELALESSDLASGRWQPDANEEVVGISQPAVAADVAGPVVENSVAKVDRPAQSATVEVVPVPRYAKRARIAGEGEDPNPVADAKRAARLVLKSGRPEQAYALLIGDVSRAKDDVEFLGLLAVAALQRQLFAEAQVVYRKLVEIDPRNDRWWAGLALVEKRLGMSARGSFEEVLKLADEGSRLRQLAVDELRQT